MARATYNLPEVRERAAVSETARRGRCRCTDLDVNPRAWTVSRNRANPSPTMAVTREAPNSVK